MAITLDILTDKGPVSCDRISDGASVSVYDFMSNEIANRTVPIFVSPATSVVEIRVCKIKKPFQVPSETSLIIEEDGSSMLADHLDVGDRIWGLNKAGELVAHKVEDVRIKNLGGAMLCYISAPNYLLSISPAHFIFCSP